MCSESHAQGVSYAYHTAFHNLLDNMELVKLIYLKASKNNKSKGVDMYSFYSAMEHMRHITPYEIDILFKMINRLTKRK